MKAGYQFLNIFFLVFHTVLIFFNVFGWIPKKTRLFNLISQSLVAFSWFFLGIWFGWGYCFCTDWHWRVRELLGYHDISNSYIHFLVLQLTGINFNEQFVMKTTLIVFLVSFSASIILNILDYSKNRKSKSD
jgi:hypothetical protein